MMAAMGNSKVRNVLIAIYILAVLGFSASARANIDVYPAFPNMKSAAQAPQVKTLVGEVAVAVDGRVYLVVSEDVVYELHNTTQDLASFNGQRVQVQGYEYMYKVGPVYQVMSFSSLLSESSEEKVSAPVLVVLQISELAQ